MSEPFSDRLLQLELVALVTFIVTWTGVGEVLVGMIAIVVVVVMVTAVVLVI